MFNYKFKIKGASTIFLGELKCPSISKVVLSKFNSLHFLTLIKESYIILGSKRNSSDFSQLRTPAVLKSRVDVFIRLLIPGVVFLVLKKKINSLFFFFSTVILWPKEYLDTLSLVLYSNILFINTKLFDISASNNIKKKKISFFLFYIFKVPMFSTWLIVFIEVSNGITSQPSKGTVLSIESLFKSAAWAERETSELFGTFFFLKSSNRKLITDYFFKMYPLLKWVPSIGFSEVYLSSEGFFFNRSVKLFNSVLS